MDYQASALVLPTLRNILGCPMTIAILNMWKNWHKIRIPEISLMIRLKLLCGDPDSVVFTELLERKNHEMGESKLIQIMATNLIFFFLLNQLYKIRKHHHFPPP